MIVYIEYYTVTTKLIWDTGCIEIEVGDNVTIEELDRKVVDYIAPNYKFTVTSDFSDTRYKYWKILDSLVAMNCLLGNYSRWLYSVTNGSIMYIGYEPITMEQYINRLLD